MKFLEKGKERKTIFEKSLRLRRKDTLSSAPLSNPSSCSFSSRSSSFSKSSSNTHFVVSSAPSVSIVHLTITAKGHPKIFIELLLK
jgi:hypothetical protein